VSEVSEDSANKLAGDTSDKYDGRFGESALKQVESFVCNTYTLCCRDPKLDVVPTLTAGNASLYLNVSSAARETGTCLTLHEGLTTDVALTFEDPSQPEFCPYATGSTNRLRPSDGTCDLLNNVVGGFSLDECREEFCPLGVEGYLAFLDKLLEWMRNNAIWLGAGFSLFVLVQMLLFVNIWNLRGSVAFNRKGGGPTGGQDPNDQVTAAWNAKHTPRGKTRSWLSPRGAPPRGDAGGDSGGALSEMSATGGDTKMGHNYPPDAKAKGACLKL
jgi:hypothetical protein